MDITLDGTVPRILITGTSGFLGGHIALRLSEHNSNIGCLDRQRTMLPGIKNFYCLDILAESSLSEVFENYDVVIHAAGSAHIHFPNYLDEENMLRVNSLGCASVARAACRVGIRRLVVVSSSSVYGNYEAGQKDEKREARPDTVYGYSKYVGEQGAFLAARDTSCTVLALRLATLYGRRDPGNMARLIDQVARKRFVWIGDGENRKSFLHVSDAAEACILAAKHPDLPTGVYNVAAEAYSVRRMVECISKLIEVPIPKLRLPAGPVLSALRTASRFAPAGSRFYHLRQQVEKFLREDVIIGDRYCSATGFRAKVALEEGLKEEVAWYLAGRSLAK